MKKLINISSQIKNNTFSYTGKGAFEAAVNNHKDTIINWLEELVPLQKQIDMLYDLTQLEFQKRNYTRILTKLLPEEYKEFVCVNILVRDSNIIAQYYANEFNLTLLYEELKEKNYLKYPGKNNKFVDYGIFQQFIMMYKDELSLSLETKPSKSPSKTTIDNQEEKLSHDNIVIEQELKESTHKAIEETVEEEPIVIKKEKTNWTQLLLGKGR
jgi:hypothetical protein